MKTDPKSNKIDPIESCTAMNELLQSQDSQPPKERCSYYIV